MDNLWKRYIFIDYCSIYSLKGIKEINDNSQNYRDMVPSNYASICL
jgi:hypothetical protein